MGPMQVGRWSVYAYWSRPWRLGRSRGDRATTLSFNFALGWLRVGAFGWRKPGAP